MEYKDKKEYAGKFENGEYGRPDPAIPAEARDDKFYLQWCRFVYGSYCYGSTYIGNGGLVRNGVGGGRSIGELRAYARGMQPVQKYKSQIDVLVKQLNEQAVNSGVEAWTKASIMNISWDNVQILSKFRDVAISKILEPQYEPVVRATDTLSNDTRRRNKMRDKMATDPRMKALFAATGIPPAGVNPDYADMEAGDVDVLEQLDGYALPAEILMQDVIGCSLDKTGWEELNRMLAQDHYDIGIMGVQAVALPGEKRIGLKYVDPAGLIIPSSEYDDGRDHAYAAHIEHIPIHQLRVETGMDEKDIWEIARSYKSYAPNVRMSQNYPHINNLEWRREFAAQNYHQAYDNFTVCVMTLYFICNDAENYVIGRRSNGSEIYDKVGRDAELNAANRKLGKEIVRSEPIQYVYKTRWVVGTNKVFDYGMDDTIVRVGEKGVKRACLPILTWRNNGPSIIERAISIVDDIQIPVLKLRALLANIPPGPRLGIDVSVLQETTRLGRQDFNLLEILKIYAGKGYLLYSSRSEFADPNFGASNKNPITPMPSGAQEDFNLFSGVIAQNIEMLRQVTGINEIADGTAQARDVLVKTMEGLQAASNNSLKPQMAAMASMYRNTCNMVAKKYQSLALHGDIEMKYWPVDANAIKTLNLTADIAMYDFDVDVRLLPTAEDIQLVKQTLLQHQAQGMLNDADVLIVMGMLREKDLKKAQVYMARAVSKNQKAVQAQKMQEIQAQTQGNIQSAQAAEQAKMSTIGLQGEIDGKLAKQQHEMEMERMKEEYRLKSEGMLAEKAATTQSALVLQENE